MLPFVKMWVAAGGEVANESVAERRKIHVDLPAELHKKLRIKAALDGVSIQALVTRLVTDAVGGIGLPAARKQVAKKR
jgi:plasmid stability protein